MRMKYRDYCLLTIIGAVGIFVISMLIVGIDYLNQYFWFFLFIFLGIPLWLLIYRFIENSYNMLFRNHICKLLKFSDNQKAKKIRINNFFRLKKKSNRIIVIVISATICTLVFLVYKYNKFDGLQQFHNYQLIVLFLLIVVLSIIAARAISITINALLDFRRISIYNTVMLDAFYGDIHMTAIRSFIIRIVIIAAGMCLSLFIAVLSSPINSSLYKFELAILFAVALVPLFTIVAGIYYSRAIEGKMLRNNLLYKNMDKIDKIMRESTSIEEIMKCKELKESVLLHSKINRPMNITLICTIISATAQIVVALLHVQ